MEPNKELEKAIEDKFLTTSKFNKTVIKSDLSLNNKFSNKEKASFLYSINGSLFP